MAPPIALAALLLLAPSAAPDAAPADVAETGRPLTLTSRGEIVLEGRAFRDDHDGRTIDRGLGMFARLEADADRRSVRGRVRGYGRLDAYDRARTVLIPEEAWLDARSARLRLRAGLDLLNWSALEGFHPADVVNARNFDSDIENLDKIGEPMAAVQAHPAAGNTVEAFALPWRTRPLLPSAASRLSFFPPGVDFSGRMRQIDAGGHLTSERFGPEGALRLGQIIGRADVSVHALQHVDRSQPTAGIDPADGGPVLIFQTVRQLGGTYQQVVGPAVIKMEAAWRHFLPPASDESALPGGLPNRDHVTLAGGMDWTVGHGSGAESTFIVEGQALLGPDADTRRLLSPFSRAALLGWRFARNDIAGQELLLVVIADVERRRQGFASVSFGRRLGDTWTVHAALRLFEAPADAPPGGLAPFRRSSHVRLALARHF